MSLDKQRPGMIDYVGNVLFLGLVLSLLFGVPSCMNLLPAEDRRPIIISLPPVFEVTLGTSAEAGESQAAEQSPPLADGKTPPPSVGRLPRLVIYTIPDNCVPCGKLKVQLSGLQEMVVGSGKPWKDLIGPGDDMAIQVVDASCEDSPETAMASTANVTRYPTILRIDADGREESRYVGTLDSVTLSRYQAGSWSPAKPAKAVVDIHSHKCPNPRCGHVWSHGGESANTPNAHLCPRCRTEQRVVHGSEVEHTGGVR